MRDVVVFRYICSPISTLLMRVFLQSSRTTSALRPLSSRLVNHLRPPPRRRRLEDGLRLSCVDTHTTRDKYGVTRSLLTSEETDTTRFIGIGAIASECELVISRPFRGTDACGVLIGQNRAKMVDVVRSNFSALLPRIEECIRRCDFVGEQSDFY